MSSLLEKTIVTQPPDLVDTFGTKWWLDRDASDYASRRDSRGITLGAEVWVVQDRDRADHTFVLVKDRVVIYESASLQMVAARIDAIKRTK